MDGNGIPHLEAATHTAPLLMRQSSRTTKMDLWSTDHYNVDGVSIIIEPIRIGIIMRPFKEFAGLWRELSTLPIPHLPWMMYHKCQSVAIVEPHRHLQLKGVLPSFPRCVLAESKGIGPKRERMNILNKLRLFTA